MIAYHQTATLAGVLYAERAPVGLQSGRIQLMTNRPSIGSAMVVITVVLALGIAGSITQLMLAMAALGRADYDHSGLVTLVQDMASFRLSEVTTN